MTYVKKSSLVSVSTGFEKLADFLELGEVSDVDYSSYRGRPVEFVEEVLGISLWEEQKKIVRAIDKEERVSVKSCNAIGKTNLAACVVLYFLHTYRPSTVVTTAPTGRQVREILWNEIASLYHKARKPLGGRLLTTRLDMSDKEKWFGIGFSTDEHNLVAFQGFHNTNVLVIVDEACHSCDTEILTNHGWKLFGDLTEEDEVLTKNPITNVAFFKKPEEYYIYPYNGDMYECKKPGRNFCVTPSHKMWISNPLTKKEKWELKPMKDISSPQFKIDKKCSWIGTRQDTKVLKELARTRGIDYTEKKISMKNWAVFMGWYLSEGCCSSDGYTAFINQSYTKNRSNWDRIVDSINNIGFYPNERKKHNKITIGSKQLVLELSKYGRSIDKYVPEEIKNATPDIIEAFLNSFAMGDGYDNGNGVIVYCTSSSKMRDDIQEMLLKLGYDSSYRVAVKKGTKKNIRGKETKASKDHYQVLRLKGKKNFVVKKEEIDIIHYEGNVYCVNVPPYHLILTRRNGYCMWSGNSGVEVPIYEAIEGIIAAGETSKLLLIGNPTDEATKFGDSFKSKAYKTYHVSAYDTPNFTKSGITEENILDGSWENLLGDSVLPRPYLVSPKWAAQMAYDWGIESPLYQVRVKGEFPTNTVDTLIPLAWAERAVYSSLDEFTPPEDPVVGLGLDIARFGDDSSVLTARRDEVVTEIQEWSQEDTMYTVGRMMSAISDYNPTHKNIDIIGIGAGVVDRLNQLELDVCGVNVAERAFDSEHFANLRAEIFWNLRLKFKNKEIRIPNDTDLIEQITRIKYVYNPRGQLAIESKSDMKKRGLKSPDKGDSLALCFYEGSSNKFTEIGNLQTAPSDEYGPTKEASLLEKHFGMGYNSIDVQKIMKDKLTYKKEPPIEVCCRCENGEYIYRNGALRVTPDEAEKRKCLMCGSKWVKKEGEWKEE